ncbi:MAG: hypothetical protein ACRC0E_09385 [Soonwooa sp.]
MNIGKEIALEAKKYALCDPWYKRMLKITQFKDLADMYFRGDDWSMKNDFPRLNTLRKYKGGVLPYQMYVDFRGVVNNISKGAFFGNTEATIEISDYEVSKLIIRHNSTVKLIAKGNAIVCINALDNAKIDIQCLENAQVTVYNYSKNANITAGVGIVNVKPSKFKE